jgi:NitT/TauT family transport system ATP-binding protein
MQHPARTETSAPIAEVRGVSVAYDAARENFAIKDVSLAIHRGEIVALLGPSGCGKTTLLRTMIGLLPPTSGEVLAWGVPLVGVHPDVALVFQSFALYPWMTVRENIAMAIEGLAIDRGEAERRIARCIDTIGLEGFEEAYPKELSGGMKQRVGFARALARAPALLCMDEPFSALDVFTAETLRREVYRLVTTREKTSGDPGSAVQSVLIITHDIEEAVFIADRVVVMGTHPGHVRHVIPVTLEHPRSYKAPEFGAMVQRLRDAFVEHFLPEEAVPKAPTASSAAKARLEPLPAVGLGHVIGVMEILSTNGAAMDVFELDELTEGDFGHTLSVVKAGEMMGFLETPRNTVLLTERGRALVAHDANGRKALINRQLRTLETFRFVIRILDRAPEKKLPREVVVEELAMRLPSQNAERLLDRVVSWGRYAELFGYEPESKTIYLDLPQPLDRPETSARPA